ncbi:MAG: hypothetical protein MJY87_08770 [Fibrobacter sp.]|nr:hypothetical protein [Fibrobacter sp.]
MKKIPQKKIVVENYYVGDANVVLHDIDSVNVCVDVEMGLVPMGVSPNLSGFSIGIHYSDWSSRDKTQDYSNPKGAFFAKAENISFYDGDLLIYGSLPQKFEATHFDAKFVLFQPESYSEQPAFVEVKNNGNREIPVNKLKIQMNNRIFRLIKNNLAVGASARVYLDSVCPQSNSNEGELLLLYDSIPVDYLVWGKKGFFQKKAVEWGLWSDESFFLKTKRDSIVFVGDGYTKGDFFYRKNTEISGSDAWRFYTKKDRLTYNYLLPSPASISMPSGMGVFLDENEPLSFAWSLVDSARVYRMTIFSKDSSVMHEKDYYGNVAKVNLPSGKYFWNVLAARSSSDFETNPGGVLEYL